MPELPEVQNVVDKISQLKGLTISDLFIIEPKTLKTPLLNFKGLTIKEIYRRGKWIVINLSSNKTILTHLAMTGDIFINSDISLYKHFRYYVEFEEINERMIFNDIRKFGRLEMYDSTEYALSKLEKKLGVEPLEEEFNSKYLAEIFSHKQYKEKEVKRVIMNQKVVVGIGNIYACESLFLSSISPFRKCKEISQNEISQLIKNIKEILNISIKLGGSSIKDFSGGGFQNLIKVYGKKKYGNYDIKRDLLEGRATFWIPFLQK